MRPPTSIPMIPPNTPPSHHDFVDERILKIPHPKKKINAINGATFSVHGSSRVGSSRISPRSKGIILSIPSVRPSANSLFWKCGVKFSSIIRCDTRSVMTHSSPRPTSIFTSLSEGTTKIKRPLSSHFIPIHQLLAVSILASSIVRH